MLCLALAKSFLTLLFSMILRGIKFYSFSFSLKIFFLHCSLSRVESSLLNISFSSIYPFFSFFLLKFRFPPTAATVSSSLLLGICSLPDTIFRVSIFHPQRVIWS